MKSTKHNVAASGFFMRRTSVANRQKNRRGTPPKERDDNDKGSMKGLWVYPEVLDVVALTTALCLAVSTGSVFSFSYDNIRAADVRFRTYDSSPPLSSFYLKEDSPYPISGPLMLYGVWSSALSSLALVMAVAVRIMLTYITNMNPYSKKRQFLTRWANPFAVFVIFCFAISVVMTAPVVYFVSWVVFPPEIANSMTLRAAGYAFLTTTILFFLLTIVLACQANRIVQQQETADHENQLETHHLFEQQEVTPEEAALARLANGIDKKQESKEEPVDDTASVSSQSWV